MGERRHCWLAIFVVLATATASHAAGTEAWVPVDARVFKFMAPASLKKIPWHAFDSLSAVYESEHFGLMFDYGIWAGRFREEDLKDRDFTDTPQVERLLIDGRQAVIVTAHTGGPRKCIMREAYIAGPTSQEDLHLTGCGDEQGVQALDRIYRSISFGPLSSTQQ